VARCERPAQQRAETGGFADGKERFLPPHDGDNRRRHPWRRIEHARLQAAHQRQRVPRAPRDRFASRPVRRCHAACVSPLEDERGRLQRNQRIIEQVAEYCRGAMKRQIGHDCERPIRQISSQDVGLPNCHVVAAATSTSKTLGQHRIQLDGSDARAALGERERQDSLSSPNVQDMVACSDTGSVSEICGKALTSQEVLRKSRRGGGRRASPVHGRGA